MQKFVQLDISTWFKCKTCTWDRLRCMARISDSNYMDNISTLLSNKNEATNYVCDLRSSVALLRDRLYMLRNTNECIRLQRAGGRFCIIKYNVHVCIIYIYVSFTKHDVSPIIFFDHTYALVFNKSETINIYAVHAFGLEFAKS